MYVNICGWQIYLQVLSHFETLCPSFHTEIEKHSFFISSQQTWILLAKLMTVTSRFHQLAISFILY